MKCTQQITKKTSGWKNKKINTLNKLVPTYFQSVRNELMEMHYFNINKI